MHADQGARLVEKPAFILSAIRSGSTLLRCILNTHSQICAPHELHLPNARVDTATWYTELALRTAGFPDHELDFLLWDRILHRLLEASKKQVIVEKTPGNSLSWRRLSECWPSARYIFLLRNPAHIVRSALLVGPDPESTVVPIVLSMIDGVEDARRELPGLTVRYEDLVAEPVESTKAVCAYLEVDWEPAMLEYGQADHGPFEPGIGDFGDAIRSGQVQPRSEPPTSGPVPDYLADRCARWGYAAEARDGR
ncbi:sulfotransferase family protein [Micromonospora sp. CA-240977]|uniref:sulfotransferase family protein n=1 Tax=Micromonospora sp. CA-240977 TaxID=3239957 RepID=UPI003D8E4B22